MAAGCSLYLLHSSPKDKKVPFPMESVTVPAESRRSLPVSVYTRFVLQHTPAHHDCDPLQITSLDELQRLNASRVAVARGTRLPRPRVGSPGGKPLGTRPGVTGDA